MSNKKNSSQKWDTYSGLAGEIVNRADKDIVFAMKFLGESQIRVNNYFQKFIEHELAKRGVNRDNHALLQAFIDAHAAELREFVFTGVSLSRQFRMHEFEELLGDRTNVFRTDIWDTLSSYIKTAEDNFRAQAKDIPGLLARLRPKTTAPDNK